jgi:hypothetical protein
MEQCSDADFRGAKLRGATRSAGSGRMNTAEDLLCTPATASAQTITGHCNKTKKACLGWHASLILVPA